MVTADGAGVEGDMAMMFPFILAKMRTTCYQQRWRIVEYSVGIIYFTPEIMITEKEYLLDSKGENDVIINHDVMKLDRLKRVILHLQVCHFRACK